ncbi:facilitated trehalose transporter Tret1-like [Melitaea cinxia]|uniref:facilitated trehalose transporter Tret1-like n=1 Tax=Melitaea cinxia TaxID=113334 RepID=UPI001E26F95D|nr:facilitated trehalose transporter Tret1-like [Melitaea cinxia]
MGKLHQTQTTLACLSDGIRLALLTPIIQEALQTRCDFTQKLPMSWRWEVEWSLEEIDAMVYDWSRVLRHSSESLTSLACSFGNMLTGMLYVWPSYTLHHYASKHTTILSSPMTDLETSLVGSLPSLGAMCGTAVIGTILSIFGRQKGGLIIVLPLMMSWLMIDLTTSSLVILIARFIGGLSAGAFLVHCPIFVSEVAEESIRGTLASAPMTCYCLGTLVSYLLGWFLTHRYIIWANIASCLIYMALMITVTESPLFLMRQNREEDARKAISHYRGAYISSKIVLEEFSRLKQLITPAVELRAVGSGETSKAEEAEKEKLNTENEDIEEKFKMSSFKMLYVSLSSRRAFTIVGLTLSFQVLMGMVAVQVYAKDIFAKAVPSLSSHMCSVMFAMVLLSGGILSTIFSDKFGRKILIVSSSVAVTLCLSGMGVLTQTSILPAWVTAVFILLYCLTFMFGAGSVPYILVTECFVPEVQSLASMILMEWVWLLNFFIVGVFPFMIKYFGVHGSFYCFAFFGIANTIIGLFFVPETKGLTNEQIQELFLRRRK